MQPLICIKSTAYTWYCDPSTSFKVTDLQVQRWSKKRSSYWAILHFFPLTRHVCISPFSFSFAPTAVMYPNGNYRNKKWIKYLEKKKRNAPRGYHTWQIINFNYIPKNLIFPDFLPLSHKFESLKQNIHLSRAGFRTAAVKLIHSNHRK